MILFATKEIDIFAVWHSVSTRAILINCSSNDDDVCRRWGNEHQFRYREYFASHNKWEKNEQKAQQQ